MKNLCKQSFKICVDFGAQTQVAGRLFKSEKKEFIPADKNFDHEKFEDEMGMLHEDNFIFRDLLCGYDILSV